MARLTTWALVLFLGFVVAVEVRCLKCGEGIAERVAEEAVESVSIDQPPQFLLYPGATLSSGYSLPGSGGQDAGWLLETDSAMAQVWDWYDRRFHEMDWAEGSGIRSDENQLMVWTQPSHLQKRAGKTMDPGERDTYRADFVRRMIKT